MCTAVLFAASLAAAQDVPQAQQAAPGSERSTSMPRTPDASVPAPVKEMETVRGIGKLNPADRNLTFLPELKPTDGVPHLAEQKSGDAEVARDAKAMQAQPLLLDRAVAVIDGEVILESDVREQENFAVFEPISVPGGRFTPIQAMQQLVNRTLLLQQMAEQQLAPPPADAAVDQQLEDLRKHLPACAGQHCETDDGWQRFLAAHGFSEGQLRTHWRERMQILSFIEIRFRTGIRIAKPEIESYYNQTLVPEFTARKMQPPALAKVSDRIDEVLLQQHVNVLLNDYLRTLKDSGNVQILDPKYAELGNSASPKPGAAGPSESNGGES